MCGQESDSHRGFSQWPLTRLSRKIYSQGIHWQLLHFRQTRTTLGSFSTVLPRLVKTTITKESFQRNVPHTKEVPEAKLPLPKNYTYEIQLKQFYTHNVGFPFLFFVRKHLVDNTRSARYPLHTVNYGSATLLSQCRRKVLQGKHSTQGRRLLCFL